MIRIKNIISRIYKKIFYTVDKKKNKEYRIKIDKGHHPINDAIFNFIINKLKIHRKRASSNNKNFSYLDIGCNVGVILKEIEGGTGVDNSQYLIKVALEQGLNVKLADALDLPFDDDIFDVAILSCVLEQLENWTEVLKEAKRVSRVVIGINPMPGSDWGRKGGYVRSIIPMEVFTHVEVIAHIDKYYFEY
jgi:SAM-dependent methyltransferase